MQQVSSKSVCDNKGNALEAPASALPKSSSSDCTSTDKPVSASSSWHKHTTEPVEIYQRPPEFIADGRTIPSPQVTSLMYSMLELGPQDKLLEIGTGSASQTKVWAVSGCEIHTIELQRVVAPDEIGLNQVYAHLGDGKLGLPRESPFTAIVATCGVQDVPDAWKDQLAPQGRLVAPVGDAEVQRLTLFRKTEDGHLVPQRIAAYTRFSMMK